jgi:hypothetical protein
MPIERNVIPLDDAARVAEFDSVAGCDFDVAQILRPGARTVIAPCAAASCIGGRSFPNRRQ